MMHTLTHRNFEVKLGPEQNPELGTGPAPSLGSPVVVLCAGHEAQSRHRLPGHGQAGGPLLEEAVPREGVAGESLLVGHHHHHHPNNHYHHDCHLVCPEGAVVLQPAPRLAGPGGPRVDAGLLVPVEDEVVPGEVGVDVGALGQRQPVSGVDTWGSGVTTTIRFRILSRTWRRLGRSCWRRHGHRWSRGRHDCGACGGEGGVRHGGGGGHGDQRCARAVPGL